MLAEAYDQLGTSLADAKLTNLAAEMYAELVADPNAPAAVLAAAASRAERQGNAPAAEPLYRRAIALDRTLWVAQNNLAMLIVKRGGDVNEAVALARTAANLQPRQPAVLDTLAQVQGKAGDFKSAALSEGNAVKVDPDNVKWKIRFAQYLLDGGNVPEAQRAVQAIEQDGDTLSRLQDPAERQALTTQLNGIESRLRGAKSL